MHYANFVRHAIYANVFRGMLQCARMLFLKWELHIQLSTRIANLVRFYQKID